MFIFALSFCHTHNFLPVLNGCDLLVEIFRYDPVLNKKSCNVRVMRTRKEKLKILN